MAVEHEPTIWGIHGGKTSDADSLSLKKNYVTICLPTIKVSIFPPICCRKREYAIGPVQ